jgi:hypothetical protein
MDVAINLDADLLDIGTVYAIGDTVRVTDIATGNRMLATY